MAQGDQGPPEQQESFVDRYRLLLTLLIPAFLLGMGRGFTVPVLPTIAAETFGAGAAGAGLLVIAPMAGSTAATLPLGYLMDRIGRRSVLVAGPVLSAAAALLILRASTYAEFLTYLTLGGIAQQMWQIGRLAAIADSGALNRRGRQITSMAGVQRVGTLAGPLAGGIVGEFLGLRVPFLMFGIAAALAAIPMYTLMQETAPGVLARRRGEAPAGDAKPLRQFITWPILILFVAQFTANIGRGGAQGNGGPYLIFATYTYGIGPAALGTVIFAMALAGLPIVLMGGQIMDRMGRKRTIVPAAGFLSLGLGMMTVTAAFNLAFGYFVTAFVVINLAISLMAGSMQTLSSDVAPPEARGRFFGLIRLIGEGGSLTNPSLFSLAVLLGGEGAGYPVAFGIFSASAAITSLFVARLIRETLTREEPAPQSVNP